MDKPKPTKAAAEESRYRSALREMLAGGRETAWSDEINPATIPDDVLYSELGRRRAAMRETFGRPRSKVDRCPCESMTLKRAQTRGKSSEHDPSCAFYRERAIIV
jgi:hypothetical protein